MTARNSHLAALGLIRNPFPYTPDAGCYFTTPHLDEQVVEIEHCILARKGFCLLTAEVGMGKSTLVRRLMADLASKNVVSALVFNTFLQGTELLAAVLHDFGLASTGNMATDIATLNSFLLENHRQGKTCLLIVDDAQNLTEDSLELIRLLCNLETDQEKLLQILLAGQPELEDTLSRHNLRQLRSRVVKHARLFGLNSTEIADYIRFRFESSGSDGTLLLATDACQMLLKETAGVPRQIHLIMDRCLYGLAARNARVIDAALMKQAIDDSRVTLGSKTDVAHVRPVTAAAQPAPSPVAVALALAVVIGAFGFAWYQSSVPVQAKVVTRAEVPPAKTPAPAPVQVAVAAPVAAAGTVAPVDDKFARTCPLTDSGDTAGQTLHEKPLPDLAFRLLGARLAREDGVCLSGTDGQHRLSWKAAAATSDLKDRPTVARMQIALSHYGSLAAADVDGLWGERSRGALRRFQSGIGLEPTGEIDALSALILEKFYVQAQ